MDIKRVHQAFSKFVGDEDITVESISGTFYAFGSELATLRLWKMYDGVENTKQGYSYNMGTFYFSLTPKF